MIMKILKKGGVVEKRGEEETKSMPHAPVHQVRSKPIEKPNNLKVFGSNKNQRSKLDSQNRLRSPMSEGGEP